MSKTPKHYSFIYLELFLFDVAALALKEKTQDLRPCVEIVAFARDKV